MERSEARDDFDDKHVAALQEKLGISRDELCSLYSALPINGAQGRLVEAAIRQRFGLVPDEYDWVDHLYDQGVITEAEYRWLQDG